MRNFEKMPSRHKNHEEGYKRHKKTQPRGKSRRQQWEEI